MNPPLMFWRENTRRTCAAAPSMTFRPVEYGVGGMSVA